jgi:hypothetical protein
LAWTAYDTTEPEAAQEIIPDAIIAALNLLPVGGRSMLLRPMDQGHQRGRWQQLRFTREL